MKTTWRDQIAEQMEHHDESWDDVVGFAIDGGKPSFDVAFDDGFGSANGLPFTLWTNRRVYFPVVYDGVEWCASVPRDVCDEATAHVGGQ